MSTTSFSVATAFALAVSFLPWANSHAATADDSWKKVEDSMNALEHPAKRPESKEEAIAFFKDGLKKFDDAAEEFKKDNPTDARRWTARVFDGMTYGLRHRLDLPEPFKDLTAAMEEVIKSSDAVAKDRGEASGIIVMSAIEDMEGGKLTADAWQKLAEAHLKEFPDFEGNSQIKGRLSKLKTDSELKSKPLDLKFQSVAGEEIDLAKLRGKVVLVDFWATWCGPCVGEVPHVVEAYQKLHPKGFEIIGISLDQDKDKLLAFTKEKNMTWAQYFDGKGWENEISSKFGIQSIPAMWLVDKKGMVVSTNARGKLEEEVEKLLGE